MPRVSVRWQGPRSSRLALRSLLFLLLAVTAPGIARAQVGGTLPPPSPPPPGTPPPAPPASPPSTAGTVTTTTTPPPRQGGGRGASSDDDVGAVSTYGAPHPMLRSAFGLEAYWWSAKGVESALPIIPYAAFNLSPSLVLDVHLPIAFVIDARVGGDRKAVAGLGNPTVGLTYVTSPDARWTWFLGGRLSAPLAGASDAPAWLTANLTSAAGMALWDLHYWAYKYVPIGARGGFEFRPKERVFLRGALEPTLYVPLDSERSSVISNTRTAELFYQLRVEAEGRSASGWGGGAGLQLVHAISAGDALGRGDNAQGAFEPFVSYTGASAFARLGLVIGLDSPLGLGFDQGKVAALRLGVGSNF